MTSIQFSGSPVHPLSNFPARSGRGWHKTILYQNGRGFCVFGSLFQGTGRKASQFRLDAGLSDLREFKAARKTFDGYTENAENTDEHGQIII